MSKEDAGGSRQPEGYGKLQSLLAESCDLEKAASVLGWDQRTYLPPGGAVARGEQLAALRGLVHRKKTSPELGQLLEGLRGYEESMPRDSDEASLIRVARREYELAARVPVALVEEHAQASAAGYRAWADAREAKDFAVFRPAMERLTDVVGRVVAAMGYEESPLDPLIELSEPGLTAARCEALFAELRAALVPLAAAIATKSPGDEDALVRQRFDGRKQLDCGREAVRAIGFDFERRGRVDLTIHPFTTSFSPDDVRITTRVDENDFGNCFFSLLHEAGHGIYEQGLPAHLRRTPLGRAASSGIHESQSRLWENIVGRSRGFWEFFLPRARAYFPEQLSGASVDDIYRAVNRVTPSLIRTEADEVTYNLHIMMRFELEKSLLEGKLPVSGLRDAWNEKMQSYLGILPPTDLEGVLQDVHWTRGPGGGFQGYTLGNVVAAQLFEAACAASPGLPDRFASGDFGPLFRWMRERVHACGAKHRPEELVEKATGKPLTAGPYLAYIREKYGRLYG
jgi:carboxypeptidase Taq